MGSLADGVMAPIRDAASRIGAGEFIRWWWDELVAMTPARWRERFSTRGIAYVLADGEQWRLFGAGEDGMVEVGQAESATLGGGEGRAAFDRLLAAAVGGASNVWLVLPRESALLRTATLPLAAEEAVRDAVGFELDRLTPLSHEQACFDCRVIGRDTSAQALELELAASARAPIENRVAKLRELGASVLGVGVEGDVGVARVPFNLLAAEARDIPAASRAVFAARLLAVAVAALASAALIFPLWQKREAFIELQPRLDRAKASADVAERLAKEIERLADEHNFLVTRKQGNYPAVVLLEDLSRMLPDTTWVQQLDIKAGPKIRELQVAGETGSSSQLVEILEKSVSLANVSFKSPLTKGVTPGTERFLLAAEIKARPLPEPMPDDALTKDAGEGEQPVAPAEAVPARAPSTERPAVAPKVPGGPSPAPATNAPARPDPKG